MDNHAKTLLIQKVNKLPERLSGMDQAYFPIFLKDDIQEGFAPGWDEEPMYGRVDSVARYSNTKRTVSFSFYVLALKGGNPPDGTKRSGVIDKEGMMSPTISEYLLFDDLPTCADKIEFLRSLTYPKFDNGVYSQPPMIYVSLSEQFTAVKGYITDLSIVHQVVSGMGLDLNYNIFMPQGWEVSVSLTILHSTPPSTEGVTF